MAGKITADILQLGDSATASQNFFLKTNADGSMQLSRGNNPTSTQTVLSITGTETVQRVMTFPAVTSAGQTEIDFSGIPNWAKEISVMLNGLSINSNTFTSILLGTSSGFESTGYRTGSSGMRSTVSTSSYDAGFIIRNTLATDILSGVMTFTLQSSNTWVASGSVTVEAVDAMIISAGAKTLPSTLDRIRITTGTGTATFDAGSVSILVKG